MEIWKQKNRETAMSMLKVDMNLYDSINACKNI